MPIILLIFSVFGMANHCVGHQLRHSRGLFRGYDCKRPTKNYGNDPCSSRQTNTIPRREFSSLLVATVGLSTPNYMPGTSSAQAATGNLASKLSQRDPAALVNSIFNIPPQSQVYPDFMHGTWKIRCSYSGYLFPSKKISRERLISNSQIPGFQKCSIVSLSDVGKDSFEYTLSIDPASGVEDRIESLTTQVNSNLGYTAVSGVKYNAKSNPNRISIDFAEYRTRNAERVELFANGRESEWIPETKTFVCSEYLRQVTFGTGSSVGVPRQAVTNYAHFWTWKQNAENPTLISGNLLTAAYLDPQDSLFFEEPSRPVAVYSHVLNGVKA
mmetsp:Transcript_35841/g.86671  ORF Transcript_35841/g.86671 Transcript_35841/m.86671 type:complete len:328 (+) Transcript_35841:1807-2790(+)